MIKSGKNILRTLSGNLILILFLLINVSMTSCTKKEQSIRSSREANILKIYTYDSFVTWGLADATIPLFEEKTGSKVIVESVGDAGNILNRLIMEKNNPQADIVIGLDNIMLGRVLHEKVLMPYRSENMNNIPEIFHFDKTNHLTPYDYGYFAFVYDSYIIDKPPATFGNIQDGIWKNKIVISDPRTSSPGLGLLLWTIATFGENGYIHFWRSIRNNILTVSSSWDEAYSMLLAGEVPIVLSYSTSPAYHIETENTDRYKAFIPQEGGFMQIEGAGIVKDTPNLELAKRFIDFMLTIEFQKSIPTSQWMFPVNKNVILPTSFNEVPIPQTILNDKLDLVDISPQLMDRWLMRWIEVMIN
ncbi:MAG: thiamine ABC transporter substrate-binding protein [Candidatus Cloacimonetes bacterium]|nr:thiamine ABC transporter substrate-binding protein [Candidatus Cloacimonadota bacterium]